MKLTVFLTVLSLFQLQAFTTYGQKAKVSLDMEGMPLKTVFKEIEKQTDFRFFYNLDDINTERSVSLKMDRQPLDRVLEELFKNTTVDYNIVEKQIVLTVKKSPPVKPKTKEVQQKYKMQGMVRDANGLPIPGVNVLIKNSLTGTFTDGEGAYVLQVLPDDILVFTALGFKTLEVSIEGKDSLTIVLEEDVTQLDAVTFEINTGYQKLPKERATGSFTQPVKGMFDARTTTDVLTKLAGITSGLVFNANTTTSNSGLDINIRGRSTIFANDQPLIVVDNFPYSGDINNINPNDVESITVLKDAAAASIWGVRAGNGVIVITTKKGNNNQTPKINFNTNVTVFGKPDLYYNTNQLSSASYIELEEFLFKEGYYDANLNDTYTYPVLSPAVELMAKQRAGTISQSQYETQINSLKSQNFNDQAKRYLYRNAANQQYNLNISGGSARSTYYVSGGYDHNFLSAKPNSYQRITLNTLNTLKPIDKLDISLGLNLIQSKNRVDNTVINTVGHVFPYSKVVDNDGRPVPIPYGYRDSFVQSAAENGFLDWSYNPLLEMGAVDNTIRNIDIRILSSLRYTFLKGLSGEIKYQYQRANLENRNFQSQSTYFTRNLINTYSVLTDGKVSGYNIPLGGILGLNESKTTSTNLRATLNYHKHWQQNELSAIAGFEYSEVRSDNNSSTLYGYNADNATFSNVSTTEYYTTYPSGGAATIPSGLSIGGTLDRIRSTFANAAYTYRDRYTLSASARVDGSNYFGVATNQKFLPLWSIGSKWDISKEPFYKLDWLPDLYFRATYGYNGNLDRSITGVTTLFYLSNSQYTNLPYAFIQNVGNPDLKWEKTGIANFAIDFSSARSILTGSFEYYFRRVTDVLGYKSFPYNTGIISLQGNYSDMSGRGFDLTLASKNLGGKVKWSTTFLFSHTLDKVTGYDVTPLASQLVAADGNGTVAVPAVGKPVFALYSYKFTGLNGSNGNPIGMLNGTQSEDYSAIINNTTFDELVYSGPARPSYFGGLNNHFSYKRIGLDIQINYKFGYYFRKPTISYNSMISGGNPNLTVNSDYDRRWQNPGDELHTNVPSMIYPFNDYRDLFYLGSEANVEKGDHIRLQDIALSYSLDCSDHPKLPLSNVQFFLYANNIGILWRANNKGIDPDAVPSSGNSIVPAQRSFTIGLKGTF